MKESPMSRLVEDLAITVADLGARGGLDEDFLSIAWACAAIGFEPDSHEAERLARNGDARWRKLVVLPYAIGGVDGPALLYVPESREGASLLRHNASMVELYGYENLHVDKEEIPISVRTLDKLRQAGELPRIDYLKIDIEGAELEVLQAAGETLGDCVALKVECSFVPQRLNQPLIWEVAAFLLGRDFWVMDARDIHRWRRRNLPGHPYRVNFRMPYSRGQIAQCDLIFLKSPESARDFDQALRLIIASAVLGYYDHAVTVLRSQRDVARSVRERYGLDLERELGEWSRRAGRRATRDAIAQSLRDLIPLCRSALNRLPYAKPARPY